MAGGVNASHRPLYPGKVIQHPLYRRLGGPQGGSGRVRKISTPPKFDPRTVQSLYRLHYPGPTENKIQYWNIQGYGVTQLVEALRQKPEFCRFVSRRGHWIIHWLIPFGRTMILESTQPLTEMSTKNISWEDVFGGLVVSMLASGTQVCGFKPGRSRWIFRM